MQFYDSYSGHLIHTLCVSVYKHYDLALAQRWGYREAKKVTVGLKESIGSMSLQLGL